MERQRTHSRKAYFRSLDGDLFDIWFSPGSEKFVGRYIRLAPLDPGEGLVIFGELEPSI